MIWFGNLNRILPVRSPEAYGPLSEQRRMLRALQAVAERAPQLGGPALLDALADTGWIDRESAQRLLPEFSYFDPDRHFAEYLRALSFRGRSAEQQFREGIRTVVEEITGEAGVESLGPEPAIRFRSGEQEGVVLSHPEVGFTIAGSTRDAVMAAIEEMPDVLVVVARNFDPQTAAQLTSILDQSEVPGTLITLNLLLGIRAHRLRYQPTTDRVIQLLGTGRPLRSADIARLGDREVLS
jgi:hypothetical protein